MNINPTFAQLLMTLIFGLAVYFHIAKKNFSVAMFYGIQSLAIVILLAASFFEKASLSLLLITLVTFLVKVVMGPAFFIRLIKRHQLKFTVSSYLSTPMTLLVVAAIAALINSRFFSSITQIIPPNQTALSLAVSSMLISIFLMINRKGALSQIIGVLSLENSIVAFTVFSGLEQSPAIQLGILFNICIWLVIAIVFVSMVYRHIGSLDVTTMSHLKD